MRFFGRGRIEPFLSKIDNQRLRDIQQRYAGSSDRYAKYADVEHWLKINIPRVRELKLDRSPPKQILDLGCGAGFFLFLAKQSGHKCLGLDVGDFPLSNELIELFGLERETWKIRAFQPLPEFGRKFDLITGFSGAFNRSEDESRGWNPEEWKFFLDDLDRHLNPGGEILLEINSGKDKRYFPVEVSDFFLNRGARVDGERVYLKHGGTISVSSA
ncbi:MAG TPA: class I SAM-dependent methyltransferase [Chthoniobacterales bacterium]|nr:class I SAM-dependent methyltransferase [Chthoniobacterales bacterium]